MANKGSKKGFIFTVLALAILAMVLLSVGTWSRAFEQSEERASQRFKGESVRSILLVTSDKSLSEFANASAFYALYKMSNYSAGSANGFESDCLPIEPESAEFPRNRCTASIEKYASWLMENGTLPPDAAYPGLPYSPDENASYTIAAWTGRVSESARLMGFNVSFSKPQGFIFRQNSPWSARVYFNLTMNLTDFEGTVRKQATLLANATVSLEGFVDPMVPRSEPVTHDRYGIEKEIPPAVKQVWKNDEYPSPSALEPKLVCPDEGCATPEGHGWFFGPATTDYPGTGIFEGEGNESERINQYILVSGYTDELPEAASLYGGVVVTSAPDWTAPAEQFLPGCQEPYNLSYQQKCLNCIVRSTYVPEGCDPVYEIYKNEVASPVIVATNFQMDRLQSVFRRGMGKAENQSFALIDNEYDERIRKADGHHRAWDITSIRDMAICGFYVHDESAPSPSYFQRMLGDVPSQEGIVSEKLGIESFLVGKWAGGANDVVAGVSVPTDALSRLDYEFYGEPIALMYRIKGMMGCKDKPMCDSAAAALNGTGHFRLTERALCRYNLGEIVYHEGSAASLCR